MVEKKWTVLNQPSMSPDLNPIVSFICHWERNFANVQELEQIVKEEWKKIPAEKCKKLIDSYQKRLKTAITAKVGTTKY